MRLVLHASILAVLALTVAAAGGGCGDGPSVDGNGPGENPPPRRAASPAGPRPPAAPVRQWRAYAALAALDRDRLWMEQAQVREETLRAEMPAEKPELDALVADFEKAGSSIRELIVRVVRSERFLGAR